MSESDIQPDIQVELIAGHWQEADQPIGWDRLKNRLLGLQKVSDKIIDINLTEWDSEHRKRAARLHRSCNRDCVFIVVGFSHGVGRGAVELANGLWDDGRYVHRLFSVDGVYWSKYFKWRAVWSPFVTPVIRLPDNVLRADVYRQDVSIPRGHEVVCVEPKRIHNVPFVDPYDPSYVKEFWPWVHSAMDEIDAIHDDIYKCVKQYAAGS